MTYKMLDGNAAAVEAMMMARVKVIAAYPITPQSSISEKLSDLVLDGTLPAQYIRVESEHTAMSATISAQMAGVRAATATSSNGLALMHEVLGMASGTRQPIVMPVVNRAVAAPWSLWCEHGDTMSARDLGWMQFFCQNVQEVFDLTTLAYKVAEDARVLCPVMVCLDGFFLSHSMQKIEIPEAGLVDAYLGEYEPKNLRLDVKHPFFRCDLTGSDEYTEMKYQQKTALDGAGQVIDEAMAGFEKTFGRKLERVEAYRTNDAEVVLVALGSMNGTAKLVVNRLRDKGHKVGLVKMTVFRPFPVDLLAGAVGRAKVVGVFDRSSGLGSQGGPLWNETRSALFGSDKKVLSYICGRGGRDVSTMILEKIYDQLLAVSRGDEAAHTPWVDLAENALELREAV